MLGKILRFILEAQLGIWVSSLTGLFSREEYFTEDVKRTISKIVENHIGLLQDGVMGDEQVEGKTSRARTSESSHQGLGSKTTTTNTKNLRVMKGGPGRNFSADHADSVAQMRREPVWVFRAGT